MMLALVFVMIQQHAEACECSTKDGKPAPPDPTKHPMAQFVQCKVTVAASPHKACYCHTTYELDAYNIRQYTCTGIETDCPVKERNNPLCISPDTSIESCRVYWGNRCMGYY